MIAQKSLRFLRFGAILAVLTGLGGCAAGGPDILDNPVSRKLAWFSYIKGEDVQAGCVAGAPDIYRFVYNGVYIEQVRTYDFAASPMPSHARMTARVVNKANLSSILVDLSHPDLVEPWRGAKAVTDIPLADVERLKRAVLSDGLVNKPVTSRSVSSIEFYWVASACIDGQFHRNVWIWPDKDFDAAAFPKLLFAWDMTGLAVNPPRKTDEFSIYGVSQDQDNSYINYFKLQFDRP